MGRRHVDFATLALAAALIPGHLRAQTHGAASLIAKACTVSGRKMTCLVRQAGPGARLTQTIHVTGARPLADALDAIEERYGIAIEYMDPEYAWPEDMQLQYTNALGKPLGRPLLIPKIRTLQFQYAEVNHRAEGYPAALDRKRKGLPYYIPEQANQPEGGVTSLIQRLLKQYTAEGGPVFGVRVLTAPTGPQWEVYPVEARDQAGTSVPQTDFLGAIIHIDKKERTPMDMLELIAEQLTQTWGRKFWLGVAPMNALLRWHSELGADNIPARQALADTVGGYLPPYVWRIYGGSGDGSYAINVVELPYRQPPRPLPPPAPAQNPHIGPAPPAVWLRKSLSPGGMWEIQTALARAGFLHTAPTTTWDANAADAARRFQVANGLQPTGVLDGPTVLKLEKFLPQLRPTLATASQMDPALAYWLQSTPEGLTEIQQALIKAGFYTGPTTGELDPRTQAAINAFRKASGLRVNGLFDYPTAEKLAPLLPKPSE